ncbi:reprolysin-like metallopeptidase [Ascidiimonas aurantiaca]|uniref:reprolysin-like metallopeptidase n=1 Tax=Ascidiimonas aurantiaca TaxID=1685432 RepID=UPI0030ED28A2
MKTNLRYVFTITIIFLSFYHINAQSGYWEPYSGNKKSENYTLRSLKEEGYTLLTLDEKAFVNALAQAPARGRFSGVSNTTMMLPDDTGKLISFDVYEAPVLSPELSAKYPDIRSYVGYSTDGEQTKVRFSVSPQGIQHMMRFSGHHTVFMEKLSREGSQYIVYTRDARETPKEMVCSTEMRKEDRKVAANRDTNDQTLRRYRLAVSTTGEYTSFHGGTVAGALAAINATVTRVNEVFENDFSVTLEVIANTEQVIFTDAATDPYNETGLNSALQATLSTTIGEAAYDVGHLFHRAANDGNAGCIGCVCINGRKGSAYSSATSPTGDTFDIDYVAHELGHQFGANHTWSFDTEATGVNAEPGSGTTIMAYAGITGANNVQLNSDPYFHFWSIFQVASYIATTTCDVETALTNNPPAANAGTDYKIPRSTAFLLAGTGSDPDTGDVLTYTWEQIDDGIIRNTTFGPTNTRGANFRSLPPSTQPIRYMPRLERVVNGTLTQVNPMLNDAWETVSNVGRTMDFAFTVRDNAAGGGQTASDIVRLTVLEEAGPFAVTSQNALETWSAGTVETITWDVANTSTAPVNAQQVDILLSTDGGQTFPVTLAQNTNNDGEHKLIVPGGIATTSARIMVKASDNIFFAVNGDNFAIEESEFVLAFPELEGLACQPDDLVINFEYQSYAGFSGETTFSTSGLPAGLTASFVPASTSTDGTNVQMTVSGTASVPTGSYSFTITGTSGALVQNLSFDLNVSEDSLSPATLLAPANGATDVFFDVALQWQEDPLAETYLLEIATDATFSAPLVSAGVIDTSYLPENLQQSTTYFWRVKSRNACGEGDFSPVFSFTMAPVNCNTFISRSTPVTISENGTPSVSAVLNVIDDLQITDIDVSVDITHTFVSDLTIRLRSPSGTEVVLFSRSCGELENIVAVFDDDGQPATCRVNPPALAGAVEPVQSLSSFFGESAAGQWTLLVDDSENIDGGSINDFRISVCAAGVFIPDRDADGVEDDDDNCPDTPNPAQEDQDQDGTGDACDTDDDNDGVNDVDDNCPFTPNAGQENADNDSAGDVCDLDDDNDGIVDTNDNCPLTPNNDQGDNDLDGLGDACDPDDDNDGILDEQDNCPFTFNPDQLDIDNDGEGDACDEDVLVSEALTPNGDGINDTWTIINIDRHPNAVITVFNRLGNEVFRTTGYNNDWNGVYKDRSERLPAGSYYYQIDLENNGSADFSGWIYITY